MDCGCVVEPVRVDSMSANGRNVEPPIPVRVVDSISADGIRMVDTDYQDTYIWEEGQSAAVLPTVTGDNEGEALRVVDGSWAKAGASEYGTKPLYVLTITYDEDDSVYVCDKSYDDVEDAFDGGEYKVKAICPDSDENLCAVSEYLSSDVRAGFYIDSVVADYVLGTVTCKRFLFTTDENDGDSVVLDDTYSWELTAAT